MKYVLRLVIVFLVCAIGLLLLGRVLVPPSVHIKRNVSTPFEFFDNEIGHTSPIIPNVVHYVLLGNATINFITFLSMVSVIKIQQPNEIWIHSDRTQFKTRYWEMLEVLSYLKSVPIRKKKMNKPTHVFGQPLSSVYHSTDIGRIQVLMEHGGIYLDTDVLILKPLDIFLNFEMVLGWPVKDNIGTQILMGHKDARFLRLWLNGYRTYKPRQWYYNAGEYPTNQILSKEPHLVHRVTTLFGVQNLLKELYEYSHWPQWKDLYSVHLLSRHPPALDFNETSIIWYKKTFGEIARWILYDTLPSLNLSSRTIWSL
ncbi:hypothetical protein AAG570_001856 [Ranatra chinensis]|uniref:Alpha-1,4-N-acetylglucosaminyltransferase n=1 Tax=Ranatra chinensis TaxID=642074 RepID=A0ABD0Y9Z4_9HEMI